MRLRQRLQREDEVDQERQRRVTGDRQRESAGRTFVDHRLHEDATAFST